jgi:hypothetical protein
VGAVSVFKLNSNFELQPKSNILQRNSYLKLFVELITPNKPANNITKHDLLLSSEPIVSNIGQASQPLKNPSIAIVIKVPLGLN